MGFEYAQTVFLVQPLLTGRREVSRHVQRGLLHEAYSERFALLLDFFLSQCGSFSQTLGGLFTGDVGCGAGSTTAVQVMSTERCTSHWKKELSFSLE